MAGPTTKPLSVPVLPGMREDVSTHLAPIGTLTYARNCRFPVMGEVHARRGSEALSAACDAEIDFAEVLNGKVSLARLPGGFAANCQGFGYRYDLEQDRLHIGGSYANAEPLGVFDVMAREEVNPGVANCPWPLSQAAVNGYVATVHSCGNGNAPGPGDNRVLLHVLTEAGALVMSAYLDSVSAAWVVVDGASSTNFILITQSTTTGLSARVITTSATGATLGGATVLGTLTSATSYWAACTWPGLGWLLAHQSAAAVMTITALTGVAAFDTATFAVTGTVPVSIYADTLYVYVGWSEGAGPSAANARVYDATLSLTAGPVALATDAGANQFGPPLFGPSRIGATAMWAVTFSPSDELAETSYVSIGNLTAAGVTTPEHQAYQCTAASAPFGNGYIWVRAGGVNNNTSTTFQRVMLLDCMDKRVGTVVPYGSWPVVIALTGQLFVSLSPGGNGAGWYRQHLATPVQLTDDTWVAGIPRMVRDELPGSLGFALAEWLRFRVGGTRELSPLGDELAVAGFPTLSHPYVGTRHYNGGSLTLGPQCTGLDMGFPLPPAINVATSNGAGALSVSSAYQWRVVIERIDHMGRRWRSAPSELVSLSTGPADDTATITARLWPGWLRADAQFFHSSRFVAHVYRSTPGGQQLYRATPPQGAPTASGEGVFTITDTISDADLAKREFIYTDGGVQNNDCAPSCRFIRATEDRMWLGGLWETEQLQSSKILVPGEPPQFSDSPAFRVVLPSACTGLAVQDGVLIAFCESAIYAVQGAGPSDQGQNAWDSPRCVTRSTGGRVLLETSAGIFFQSKRGIELLPRGLGELVFIGAPVQTTFDPDVSDVLSCAVVTSTESRTARFCIGGRSVLVYDLDTGGWSVDEYPFDVVAICDSEDGAVIARESLSASGYGFLLESGALSRDSTGDEPIEISSVLTWAAVHPFSIAGWGRFNDAVAMFDALPAGYSTVNCSLFVDVDSPAVPDPGFAFVMNTLSEPGYRKHIQKQVDGTAVRLRITTAGGGWRCMGWTLSVDDAHGGSRRTASTEQG